MKRKRNQENQVNETKNTHETMLMIRVTTCLENLEMSGNLTAVREMLGILLKIRELSGKCQGENLMFLSEKSCLKLFIVSCIFASIQVFSRSLFCVKH